MGAAGLPKLSNHFLRHSGCPALDLRTAPHAFGCTPTAPRTGTCTFRPCLGRAPGNRAPRKPRAKVAQGNRLLQEASPTAMQSGWFFQVPPCLSRRLVPAPVTPAGPGGWLGDTGTRRGEAAAANQLWTAGPLSYPASCSPGGRSTRRWKPNCKRGWYRAPSLALTGLPAPGIARPPSAPPGR